MVKRGEEFLCGASERLASLKKVVAGRRSRFSEKESLRGVFEESARAAAVILVCPHRSLPNQPVQTTRLSGAVFRGGLLRSTFNRGSKSRDCARQRASDQWSLEASRMIFGVFTSAASPVGVLRAERVGCSSGYKLSVASSRRGVFSRVQKKKKRDGFGAGELKVLPPVAREVLFALVDAGRFRMSCTPHFPNQRTEPTRLTGAVVRERLLRSTFLRSSKELSCARLRVAHH